MHEEVERVKAMGEEDSSGRKYGVEEVETGMKKWVDKYPRLAKETAGVWEEINLMLLEVEEAVVCKEKKESEEEVLASLEGKELARTVVENLMETRAKLRKI